MREARETNTGRGRVHGVNERRGRRKKRKGAPESRRHRRCTERPEDISTALTVGRCSQPARMGVYATQTQNTSQHVRRNTDAKPTVYSGVGANKRKGEGRGGTVCLQCYRRLR